METRYCIEYVNPRYPLCDNGSINVRYDRVLTLEQAEHDLTLILSFGGKILDLYMGNVVDGETEEWNPKPMIIDDDDWFTIDWLISLNKTEEKFNGQIDPEIQKVINDNFWDMLGEDSGDKLISLNKACEWLENNLPPAMLWSDIYLYNGDFIEDFKKAMKGK